MRNGEWGEGQFARRSVAAPANWSADAHVRGRCRSTQAPKFSRERAQRTQRSRSESELSRGFLKLSSAPTRRELRLAQWCDGARASARFHVQLGEAQPMAGPLAVRTLQRRERRAPLVSSAWQTIPRVSKVLRPLRPFAANPFPSLGLSVGSAGGCGRGRPRSIRGRSRSPEPSCRRPIPHSPFPISSISSHAS
jgi:hypothetical protein